MNKKEPKKEPTEENKPQAPQEVKLAYEEYNGLKEKAELSDGYFDKLLRLQAETENIKKRLAKERADFIKFANEELISELVDIMDDFHRAIDSAGKNHDLKLLLEGVEMITKHLQSALKQRGLEEISEAGVAFDHNKHEAVLTEDSEEYPENTVIEVLRKGYELSGRVIRPAMVKVAKKQDSNGTRDEG